MKSKIKYKYGMSKKLMICMTVLCIITSASSIIAGFIQYDNTIKKLYNEHGYAVGEMIIDNIDADKIEEYTKTWKKDGYYGYMQLYFEKIIKASGAKYLYIAIPNEDGTIRYIYDSSGMELGSVDPVTDFLDEALKIYNTGEMITDNYFDRESPKYGWLTSSIIPIKTDDGNTVALLFVDIAMEIIESTLLKYILRALIISGALLVIFLIFSWAQMNKYVINPIHTIEKCLDKFVDNNAEITEELNAINTKDELQTLSSSIYTMETAIVDYIDRITNITAEKERIGAELNIATQIQANMLPSIFPPFPDRTEFDIYATMTPAKEVGGDFYDFFMIDDSHVGIVIADVSGKGVPAALFMAISKTLIKNRTQMGTFSPAEVLAKINNQLCENNRAQMFVTVWLGILDVNTGKIIASNAGHEFPAIKHDGKFELLKDKHGLVLAGIENVKYTDYEIQLQKGDSLYVYTDGVAEATNINNELFGTERMIDALNINPDGDCRDILKNVSDAIDEFVNEAPQFDDITMLCLEYYGKDN